MELPGEHVLDERGAAAWEETPNPQGNSD